jgi:nicotinamide-nucleotide amidase
LPTAAIISTGTELLTGATIDSNSVFLSSRLQALGIKVVMKVTVSESREDLLRILEWSRESADLIITSGGLGPTKYDVTKETVSEFAGLKLELRKEAAEQIRAYFLRRKREMPRSNLKQAMFPPEAKVISNLRGTAPGMYLKHEQKLYVLLPGPPQEMKHMFIEGVEPLLKKEFSIGEGRIQNRIIKIFGQGESRVEELLQDLLVDSEECSISLLAKEGEIHICLTAQGDRPSSSQKKMDQIISLIQERLGNSIFGFDDESLVERVAYLLVNNNKTVALAESCTGGLVSKLLTDIPGSSQFFWGSGISYSNAAKMALLEVSAKNLEKYGAVSEVVAREMARGIRKVSGADFGLAITGIAGPAGGSDQKPVGLVYIALVEGDYELVKELRLAGDRNTIRLLAAKSCLDMLRRHIITGGSIH